MSLGIGRAVSRSKVASCLLTVWVWRGAGCSGLHYEGSPGFTSSERDVSSKCLGVNFSPFPQNNGYCRSQMTGWNITDCSFTTVVWSILRVKGHLRISCYTFSAFGNTLFFFIPYSSFLKTCLDFILLLFFSQDSLSIFFHKSWLLHGLQRGSEKLVVSS